MWQEKNKSYEPHIIKCFGTFTFHPWVKKKEYPDFELHSIGILV